MRGGRPLGCAGFIGVVNRSQKNIEERLEIKEAQKAEQEFFDGHPSYANMSNRLGIPYLSKTLSVTLMRHVRSCLPALRNEITSTTLMLREQLDSFGGESWGRMEKDQGSVLMKLIAQCAPLPLCHPVLFTCRLSPRPSDKSPPSAACSPAMDVWWSGTWRTSRSW